MLISEAKKTFETKLKIAGGLNMPSDADLSAVFKEALLFVASKCIPKELLKDIAVDTDEEVYRSLADGYFILTPKTPIFDTEDANYVADEHIQIDTELDYAVINKAAALYSRDAKSIAKFEEEAARVINRYKANFNKVGA